MKNKYILYAMICFFQSSLFASDVPVIVVTNDGFSHFQAVGPGGTNPVEIHNFSTLNNEIKSLSGSQKITYSLSQNNFIYPDKSTSSVFESMNLGTMNGKYTVQYQLSGSSDWKSIQFTDSFDIALTDSAAGSSGSVSFNPIKFAPYGTTSSSSQYFVNYMYFNDILKYGKLFIANTGNNPRYQNNQVVPGSLNSSGVPGAPGINGSFNNFIANLQFPFKDGAYIFVYCVDKNNNYLSDLSAVSAADPATMHVAYYNSNLTLLYKFVVQDNITQSFSAFDFGMADKKDDGNTDAIQHLDYPNTLIFIASEATATPSAVSATTLFNGLGVSPPKATSGGSKKASSGSVAVELALQEEVGFLDIGLQFDLKGDSYFQVIDLADISKMASKSGKTVDFIADIQKALAPPSKNSKSTPPSGSSAPVELVFSAGVQKGKISYELVVSAQLSNSTSPLFSYTVETLNVTDPMGGYTGPPLNSATLKEINIGYQTNNMNHVKMFNNAGKITFKHDNNLSIVGKIPKYVPKPKGNGKGAGSSGSSGAFG